MKNTEYKDVFDFSEEALSMENKFSAPSFPSFKNAFTLGENIRGMNNVSPLATVKFFNQTPDDILTKYYPDSGPVVEGTFAVVQDIGTDPEPVITKTVKDFYYYGVEEVNNFAFRVILGINDLRSIYITVRTTTETSGCGHDRHVSERRESPHKSMLAWSDVEEHRRSLVVFSIAF